MISLSPKGGTRASECIECCEKFPFLYENFQIDSKRVRINGYSQYSAVARGGAGGARGPPSFFLKSKNRPV